MRWCWPALPGFAVGRSVGRTRADGDESVPGPDDRVEVLAFLAGLAVGPFQAIDAGHPQAVQADADEDAVAEGDVHQRVDRLDVGRVLPVLAVADTAAGHGRRRRRTRPLPNASRRRMFLPEMLWQSSRPPRRVVVMTNGAGERRPRRGRRRGPGICSLPKPRPAGNCAILGVLEAGLPGLAVARAAEDVAAAVAADRDEGAVAETTAR